MLQYYKKDHMKKILYTAREKKNQVVAICVFGVVEQVSLLIYWSRRRRQDFNTHKY